MVVCFFFFKQKTAYEMRISDWSSDVCSSDLDHALITVGALDAGAGATDFNFEEAQIARAMIDNAASVIVAADASKFERRAAFAVCPLERITALLTDRRPEGTLAAALAAAGASVH